MATFIMHESIVSTCDSSLMINTADTSKSTVLKRLNKPKKIRTSSSTVDDVIRKWDIHFDGAKSLSPGKQNKLAEQFLQSMMGTFGDLK